MFLKTNVSIYYHKIVIIYQSTVLDHTFWKAQYKYVANGYEMPLSLLVFLFFACQIPDARSNPGGG